MNWSDNELQTPGRVYTVQKLTQIDVRGVGCRGTAECKQVCVLSLVGFFHIKMTGDGFLSTQSSFEGFFNGCALKKMDL